jgi:SAM-dependent methyltransferase
MHDTAYEHGRLFFALYASETLRTVVELGSQDVNGSLRDHCPPGVHYIGLDVMPAKGVDLVIDPLIPLPLASDTADAVVTSSAFEHDVCFWNTFLELIRILRPGGLLYLNAPANGDFHRYPLDCWRFYPDAGAALVQWAARSGMRIELVESFIGLPQKERWADFVAVFRKSGGPNFAGKGRIADHARAINIHEGDHPLRVETTSMPDMSIAADLRAELAAARDLDALLSADLLITRQHNDSLAADLIAARRHSDTIAANLITAQQHNDTLAADLVTVRQCNVTLSADLSATQETVATLRQDLAAAERRIATIERALDAIQSSRSWRMTGGLRWIATRLRRR